MIKNIKIKINLVLGIITGFFLSQMFIVEGYVFIEFMQKKNTSNLLIDDGKYNILRFLALIIFLGTILIFNTKKIKRITLNKIGVYLILSIVLSAFITIELIIITMGFIVKLFPNIINFFQDNNFLSINIMYLIVLLGVAIFITISMIFINKKVKYIKFITEKIKEIEKDGFGKIIEVKGEDELANLCISINSMSLELRKKIDNEKKLEENKNELITNVSHDLRTPLTSIIGYINLLKESKDYNKEKFDEYIWIIDEKAKGLNKLINELFEYTKLSNYDVKLNYNNINLCELVDQIFGEYILIFKEANLSLEKYLPKEDVFINVDIEKMVRVLENLLINAKKYSVKNTKVSLRLFEENNNVIISVTNKSENISNEDLENIFERFYKIDKARSDLESSGLGLNIVKRIVELHNGLVKVELNDDFITFSIILPNKK
ncbi:cell wall metabolism sensor histidine kinase WalK [uncultured Clostridium sp.]|uniref:sensor histidine kinase n=2 Tax=uncultured Clostridium sp. TaxID=59620 RepID=UPI002622390B|nr:HAMP domain-containing sensor histidine kinase [uncultured Clostridium sp.]